MRRREALAGIGSVVALGAAGAIAVGGFPSVGDDPTAVGDAPVGTESGGDDPGGKEPIPVETIDAPGSEAGEVSIPAAEQPAFVDFFGTWCPPCIEQMPALAEANERIGEEVLFVSVTTENVGGSVTEAEVAEWWETHGGEWTLGIDPTAELAARYNPPGYPSAFAIGTSGAVQWSDSGVKTADELVAGIEQAIE
jgi:thiol-disulfide isomerase/thioredoxin